MIVTYSELPRLRYILSNHKTVLVGGCYDLLHTEHVTYLERCRELGDVLIVSVSSDDRVKERKGNQRPIIPQSDRVRMLAALTCVDFALIAPSPHDGLGIPTVSVIRMLKPDIFATSDPRFHEYKVIPDLAETKIIHVPDTRTHTQHQPMSTTDIVNRIQALSR